MSNFERVLWYYLKDAYGEQAASDKVRGYIRDLKEKGGFKVDTAIVQEMRKVFSSADVSDLETIECMKEWYPGYLLDPHTAVGVVSAEKCKAVSVWRRRVLASSRMQALGNSAKFTDFASKELQTVRELPRKCIYIPTGGDFDRALQGQKGLGCLTYILAVCSSYKIYSTKQI